jgi:hypothetical protein
MKWLVGKTSTVDSCTDDELSYVLFESFEMGIHQEIALI